MTAAAAVIPEGPTFVVFNLLRYKPEANYDDRPEQASCSGQEAYYSRYVPAFAKVATLSGQKKAFRLAFLGSVIATLVGPAEEGETTWSWWSTTVFRLFVPLRKAGTLTRTHHPLPLVFRFPSERS